MQQELLDAAERCLEQWPSDAIGIRHIAREANVNSAMINYYFGGKQGLFVALYEALERSFSNSLRDLEDRLTPASRPPIAQLIGIQIDFYTRHQGLFKLVWRELQGAAEAAYPGEKTAHSSMVYASVLSLLRRMMQLNLIQQDINPSYAAYIIVSLCGHPFVMGAMFEKNSGIPFSDLKDGHWAAYVTRVVEDHLGLSGHSSRNQKLRSQ
ncbi:MAG: TetR/AcrR family transcriptional regulator [Spongiibacteraceae bacterium]